MSNVKTIILTGEETEIDFEQNYMCFWVQNLGSSDVYASNQSGIVPDSDGVISIPTGSSARVSAPNLSQINKLYLSGSGKVQIVGTYSVHCPFKMPAGGAGKSDGYVQNGLLANLNLSYLGEAETAQISSSNNFLKYTEEMTVECCCMSTGVQNTNGIGRFFDSGIAETTEFLLGINYETLGTLEDGYYTVVRLGSYVFADSEKETDTVGVTNWNNLEFNKIHTLTVKITSTNVDFYCNGEKTAENQMSINRLIGKTFSPLNIKYGLIANRIGYGYIYSLRMYNRALSDSEISANFAADFKNFT